METEGMGQSRSAATASSRAAPGKFTVAGLAFFLDVDGTLLEIAPTPDQVVAGAELLSLLRHLHVRSSGAVAFVSGRSIVTLDAIFQPLQLPAAGLHGFERRNAAGAFFRRPLPDGVLLFRARAALQALIQRYPELLLEDKRFSLALHYRQVPELEVQLVAEVSAIVESLGPQFELQRGRCVVEIRPAAANKAAAIAQFMQEPPFAGRRPVCLGDDLTDECAFEWINAAGGVSVAVGVERDSQAQAHLHSVAAARLWLRELVERSS
jgi:trehalose 6-phosphate phosphatase